MANSFFKIKSGLSLAVFATEADLASISGPQVGDVVVVGEGQLFTFNGTSWAPGAKAADVASALVDAKDYTDAQIAQLVNSAPAVLDTLKELADALGQDPNFATTVATNISNAQAAEQGRAEAAEAALQGQITALSGSTALADAGLQGQITSLSNTVDALTTDDVDEASHLYFTDARAKSAAVVDSMAGSQLDQAPSVSSVKGAIQFLPSNSRYVAKNGSDSTGNGSMAAPFASVQAALDSLPAGGAGDIPDCVIYVHPGVYTQSLTISRTNTHIVGLQSPRKNIQAVILKGNIKFEVATAEAGGIFQNISSISNCLLTNESGAFNTVDFLGSQRTILHLKNCQVYQYSSGYSAVCMNNTSGNTWGTLSRIYLDDCVIQNSALGAGHALDLTQGVLYSAINTEFSRERSGLDPAARVIKMSNGSTVAIVRGSSFSGQGTYIIEMAGTGTCSMSQSMIESSKTNTSGVLVAAGTTFTAMYCLFNNISGTGKAVDGAAGAIFAFSANTYNVNSTIAGAVTQYPLATDLTTSVINEGSKLFFTDARAKSAAVVDSLAGSQTDQAPSVSSVKSALAAVDSAIAAVSGTAGGLVVNTLAGNEADKAPSVQVVNGGLSATLSAADANALSMVNGAASTLSTQIGNETAARMAADANLLTAISAGDVNTMAAASAYADSLIAANPSAPGVTNKALSTAAFFSALEASEENTNNTITLVRDELLASMATTDAAAQDAILAVGNLDTALQAEIERAGQVEAGLAVRVDVLENCRGVYTGQVSTGLRLDISNLGTTDGIFPIVQVFQVDGTTNTQVNVPFSYDSDGMFITLGSIVGGPFSAVVHIHVLATPWVTVAALP